MSYRILLLLVVICSLFWQCENENNSSLPEQLEWSADGLAVGAGKQDTVIRISASGSWYIEGVSSWCICSPVSGMGDADVVISLSANNENTARETTLSLRSGTLERTIRVFQQGTGESASNFCSFQLILPLQNQVDVARHVKFECEITDASVEPIGFIVSWSKDLVTWESSVQLDSPEFVTETVLDSDSKYYWKMTAIAPDGKRCESRNWSFFTGKNTYFEGYVITYEKNREKNPVNVVFLGDGFAQADYENGKFDRVMREAIEGLFIREPFRSYRSYFNFYAVVALSAESGISDETKVRNTAFGMKYARTSSTYNPIAVEREGSVYQYARMVPGVYSLAKTPLVVVGNETRYAGLTLVSDTTTLAVITISGGGGTEFANLVAHELGGHGIGRLGDEYVYYSSTEIPSNKLSHIGWFANLDVTGDKDKVKWKHFIGHPDYPEVGVYEGGLLYGKGIWRATANSCMKEIEQPYNAPGREAIVKRILSIAGEEYSFEKFVEKDKK